MVAVCIVRIACLYVCL